MEMTKADDELFTRAVSGYRDVFLVRHSFLPEYERNELWRCHLLQFMAVPNSTNPHQADNSRILGHNMQRPDGFKKRCRQDAAYSLAGSGPLLAKRRVTAPGSPVTIDLARDLSHLSAPAAFDAAGQPLGTDLPISSSSLPAFGSGSSYGAIIRSHSRQTQASCRQQLATPADRLEAPHRPQKIPRRIQHVSDYSPSEYARQYLDDVAGQANMSVLLKETPTDLGVEISWEHRQQCSSPRGGLGWSTTLQSNPTPYIGGADMSRSGTAESLCGGLSTMGFGKDGPGSSSSILGLYPATGFTDISLPVSPMSYTSLPPASPGFDQAGHLLPEPNALPVSNSCLSFFPLTPASPAGRFCGVVDTGSFIPGEKNSPTSSLRPRRRGRSQEKGSQSSRRPIAPKTDQHKLVCTLSLDGTAKRAAETPKASVQQPSRAKIQCDLCSAQSEGFHGEHELRRHKERAHAVIRKVWVCVDISSDKQFLASCKACRNGKRYGANYNAAAHLRRTHFNPCQRGRGRGNRVKNEKRGGKGGGNHPPMEVLRQWMVQKEEVVVRSAKTAATEV